MCQPERRQGSELQVPGHGSGRTAAAPQWVWQSRGPCPGSGRGELSGAAGSCGSLFCDLRLHRGASLLCRVR